MKALRQDRFGPPADVLELVDDVPAPLQAHDVLIQVETTPIHPGDLKNIEGEKVMVRNPTGGDDLLVPLPQIPGVEGVGRIVDRGAKVETWQIGDRVYLPIQCGSWRTHVRGDGREIFAAPDGDPLQLCSLINAVTAEMALTDILPLQAGDWLIQNAANSNVGRILISLAKLRGIKTINIVRRESVAPELYDLGADLVVVDGPNLKQNVRDAIEGAPLRLALDAVAGDATTRLAECVSDGGTIANYGIVSGKPATLPTSLLLYKQVVLRGYYMGYQRRARPLEEQRIIIDKIAGLIADGTLKAKIAAAYPLSAYREAVRHAAKDGADRDGKVIFDLSK